MLFLLVTKLLSHAIRDLHTLPTVTAQSLLRVVKYISYSTAAGWCVRVIFVAALCAF